jgi:uncharacterized RDD family membrane protein YckC
MATTARTDSLSHDEGANELVTGEAVALDLRPASFVLRAAGTMIDFVVYVGSYVLLLLLLVSMSETFGLDEAVSAALGITTLVLCIVVAPTAVETISQGKSLGKLAVGARIVRDDGGAIGFRHAFMRALAGILELFMTVGGLAAVVALLNGRSKRLGDLLAGTYSQYERVSKESPPVFGVPVELAEWARTADVARMPDALARRIAQFLHQSAKFTPESRQRLARELASEASVWVSPLPVADADAELFLAAVAAIRRDREYAALQLEKRGLDTLAPTLGGLPHRFPDR